MMIEMERWEIWEANVPFEEGTGSKKRPVLYLSHDEEMYVFSLKMTSHEPRYKKMEGEYEIMRWKEAGLEKPTVVQCSKKLKLKNSDFTGKKYGRLSATDIILLLAKIKQSGTLIIPYFTSGFIHYKLSSLIQNVLHGFPAFRYQSHIAFMNNMK